MTDIKEPKLEDFFPSEVAGLSSYELRAINRILFNRAGMKNQYDEYEVPSYSNSSGIHSKLALIGLATTRITPKGRKTYYSLSEKLEPFFAACRLYQMEKIEIIKKEQYEQEEKEKAEKRLCDAAPDLLEALKAALSQCLAWQGEPNEYSCEVHKIIVKQAREALAKAGA